MIKITVSASKEYDVVMERGALSGIPALMEEAGIIPGKKLCIVADETTNRLFGGESCDLWQALAGAGFDMYRYVFEGGEKSKTMNTITGLLNYLADNRFSRSDMLIALGGGIVGDVTGFAAASFLRGVDYIQIPTTLLAIVDSSVGGKTGVNLDAGKNLAGAFWQPSLVVFDPYVLDTLSYDAMLDGIAEAVKAGFIGDRAIIDEINALTSAADSDFLTEIAARAVEVKRIVVEEDERDTGSRQLLNFGHTLAHAIEKLSDYRISHGHAVAMGMVIVSSAADALEWSEEPCSDSIWTILTRFKFPLDCPYSTRELTRAALADKKIRGNEITLVIPRIVGKCRLKTIPTDQLEGFISCGIQQLEQLKGKDI